MTFNSMSRKNVSFNLLIKSFMERHTETSNAFQFKQSDSIKKENKNSIDSMICIATST